MPYFFKRLGHRLQVLKGNEVGEGKKIGFFVFVLVTLNSKLMNCNDFTVYRFFQCLVTV